MRLEVMRVDLPRQLIKKATPLPKVAPDNQDETQSSVPASFVPPSFMHPSMRNIFQEELVIFGDALVKKAVAAIETKINLMILVMERHNLVVKSNLEALVHKVTILEELVSTLKASIHMASSSAQEPPQEPLSFDIGLDSEQLDDTVMVVVAAIGEEHEEAAQEPSPS